MHILLLSYVLGGVHDIVLKHTKKMKKKLFYSSTQAGCVIKTECEVQCVVRNPYDTCEIEEAINRRNGRRWLVFLNEFDYILSDSVVLSGMI